MAKVVAREPAGEGQPPCAAPSPAAGTVSGFSGPEGEKGAGGRREARLSSPGSKDPHLQPKCPHRAVMAEPSTGARPGTQALRGPFLCSPDSQAAGPTGKCRNLHHSGPLPGLSHPSWSVARPAGRSLDRAMPLLARLESKEPQCAGARSWACAGCLMRRSPNLSGRNAVPPKAAEPKRDTRHSQICISNAEKMYLSSASDVRVIICTQPWDEVQCFPENWPGT